MTDERTVEEEIDALIEEQNFEAHSLDYRPGLMERKIFAFDDKVGGATGDQKGFNEPDSISDDAPDEPANETPKQSLSVTVADASKLNRLNMHLEQAAVKERARLNAGGKGGAYAQKACPMNLIIWMNGMGNAYPPNSRANYAALNTALMKHGIPPVLIPAKTLPHSTATATSDQTAMLWAHIYFDLLWIRMHHKEHWTGVRTRKWHPLITGTEINTPLLDEFLRSKWDGPNRVKNLNVPLSVSRQLRVIRSKDDVDRQKKIREILREAPGKLDSLSLDPLSRMDRKNTAVRLIELQTLLYTNGKTEAGQLLLALEGNLSPTIKERNSARRRAEKRADLFRKLGFSVWERT